MRPENRDLCLEAEKVFPIHRSALQHATRQAATNYRVISRAALLGRSTSLSTPVRKVTSTYVCPKKHSRSQLAQTIGFSGGTELRPVAGGKNSTAPILLVAPLFVHTSDVCVCYDGSRARQTSINCLDRMAYRSRQAYAQTTYIASTQNAYSVLFAAREAPTSRLVPCSLRPISTPRFRKNIAPHDTHFFFRDVRGMNDSLTPHFAGVGQEKIARSSWCGSAGVRRNFGWHQWTCCPFPHPPTIREPDSKKDDAIPTLAPSGIISSPSRRLAVQDATNATRVRTTSCVFPSPSGAPWDHALATGMPQTTSRRRSDVQL